MKWNSKLPRDGNRRTIKRFLLFPTLIDREWRWLETSYIYQVWNFGWENEKWTTEKDYLNKNS